MFIESVHRLSDVGTVVTHASRGTSQDDFEAEWRQITLFTVEGDLCNRCEIFDEANLDAALARLDELTPQTRRLENAASQVVERFRAHFAARDWDAMAETMADDFSTHDRRRVVNAGVRNGRAAQIANMRARGRGGLRGPRRPSSRPAGSALRSSASAPRVRDQQPGEFIADAARHRRDRRRQPARRAVLFDPDDIDAAFEELDARYLAGEAAAHAHIWSVITKSYAATQPARAPCDDAGLGERRPSASFGSNRAKCVDPEHPCLLGHLVRNPESTSRVVHRLTNLGAVVARNACDLTRRLRSRVGERSSF